MTPRGGRTVQAAPAQALQPPLPCFKKEVAASDRARVQADIDRLERKRALSRARSQRYRDRHGA